MAGYADFLKPKNGIFQASPTEAVLMQEARLTAPIRNLRYPSVSASIDTDTSGRKVKFRINYKILDQYKNFPESRKFAIRIDLHDTEFNNRIVGRIAEPESQTPPGRKTSGGTTDGERNFSMDFRSEDGLKLGRSYKAVFWVDDFQQGKSTSVRTISFKNPGAKVTGDFYAVYPELRPASPPPPSQPKPSTLAAAPPAKKDASTTTPATATPALADILPTMTGEGAQLTLIEKIDAKALEIEEFVRRNVIPMAILAISLITIAILFATKQGRKIVKKATGAPIKR